MKLPDGYSLKRLDELSNYHDFNCQFEPFKDYLGGDNVIKDCQYPMPTLNSLLQIMPSRKLSGSNFPDDLESNEVRIDLDDDQLHYTNPSFNKDRLKGLQGQGEEISLTEDGFEDLQKLLQNTEPKDPRAISPYTIPKHDDPKNKMDFASNLIDMKTRNLSNQNSPSRNKKSFNRPASGRNINMMANQPQLDQRSYMGLMPNPRMMNPMTPHNYGMVPIPNINPYPPNSNMRFRNAAPVPANVLKQKAWSSAHRDHSGPPIRHYNQNVTGQPTKEMLMRKEEIKRQFSNDVHTSDAALKISEVSNNYITEDWFAQIDKNSSNIATTLKNNYQSHNNSNAVSQLNLEDESFLLDLVKHEDSNQGVDPSLIDLNLGPSMSGKSNASYLNKPQRGLADIDLTKNDPNLAEKNKELENMRRMIEEQKKQLEKQQRDFEQIKYAESMRLREEAAKLQEKQTEIMRLQRLNLQRKQTYQELDMKRKQDEEEKKSSKKVIEDHYILNINDIKIANIIGQGGSAKVYKGIYKDIDVAIKRLNIKQLDEGKAKQEFKREVNTLMKARHPNLILFVGVAMDDNNLCIVTEF